MQIYDITLPIRSDMPVWPGDPKPTLRQLSSIQKGDESNVTQIRMSVHTGTHIDAPKHFIDTGKSVDQIPINKLVGTVLVMAIDISVDKISAATIQSHPQIDQLNHVHKILFKTRNSKLWQSDPHVFNQEYVAIDASGAEYLIEKNIELVGVDYLSIAPYEETSEPHQIFLSKEVILLEVIDLSQVPEGIYEIYCLPLNIFGSEGAPARVILLSK
jgi:arylformamidase